jgi:hypothetical protein
MVVGGAVIVGDVGIRGGEGIRVGEAIVCRRGTVLFFFLFFHRTGMNPSSPGGDVTLWESSSLSSSSMFLSFALRRLFSDFRPSISTSISFMSWPNSLSAWDVRVDLGMRVLSRKESTWVVGRLDKDGESKSVSPSSHVFIRVSSTELELNMGDGRQSFGEKKALLGVFRREVAPL